MRFKAVESVGMITFLFYYMRASLGRSAKLCSHLLHLFNQRRQFFLQTAILVLKTFDSDSIITELASELCQGLLLLLSLKHMYLLLIFISLLLEVQLLILCDSLRSQESIEFIALTW